VNTKFVGKVTSIPMLRQYIPHKVRCLPHYTVPSNGLLQYVTEMLDSVKTFVPLHKMSPFIIRELTESHDGRFRLDIWLGERKKPSRADI
jgi:hypothetical protein